MMIARPTAASAAATVMTKNTITWPSIEWSPRRERDEGQVRGVEHQLDRHEDDDHVAADQHADGADGEETPRERKIVLDRHHGSVRPPRLASTTAPTIATSSRSEVISKDSDVTVKSDARERL